MSQKKLRPDEKQAVKERKRLDGYKEVTPVIYGKSPIKYLYYNKGIGGELLFELHWHERMELLRVVSGSLELSSGEKKVVLYPGEAAVLNPYTLHCGHAGPDGVEYHTLMFDVEKLCNGANVSEKYLKPILRCETDFDMVVSEPEVIWQIDRLAACFQDEKKTHPLLAMGIVYEVLGMLYVHAFHPSEKTVRVNKEFGEVLEYISSHFCEKISAKTLSAYFNYNETYFCRRFKELTGLTVMKYIQTLRLEESLRFLENTQEEISVIAGKCGFSDTCYFSNCFRRQFGYTPTEFRRMHVSVEAGIMRETML